MNRSHRFASLSPARAAAALLIAAGVAGAGALYTPVAIAGQAPADAPASQPGARPAAEVLANIGKAAGVAVLADAGVTGRAPFPVTLATPETVEQQIAAIVKALPRGTTWAKLYLPAPAKGRAFRADDMAAYAQAQTRLLGRPAGATPEPGMVEILGQRLPADQSQAQIAVLNLQPVYLVTGPPAANGLADWGGMTLEQRRQAARQMANQVLNMDPAVRLQ